MERNATRVARIFQTIFRYTIVFVKRDVDLNSELYYASLDLLAFIEAAWGDWNGRRAPGTSAPEGPANGFPDSS